MVKCRKGRVTIIGNNKEVMADIGTLIHVYVTGTREPEERLKEAINMFTIVLHGVQATSDINVKNFMQNMIDEEDDE